MCINAAIHRSHICMIMLIMGWKPDLAAMFTCVLYSPPLLVDIGMLRDVIQEAYMSVGACIVTVLPVWNLDLTTLLTGILLLVR